MNLKKYTVVVVYCDVEFDLYTIYAASEDDLINKICAAYATLGKELGTWEEDGFEKHEDWNFFYQEEEIEFLCFGDLLNSGTQINCDIIIGNVDMPASLVWENLRVTEYGWQRFKPIMESPYEILENGNIEIFCDDYKLGEEFARSAAGDVGIKEFDRLFEEVCDGD
jgi:hypothetical protein